MHIYNLPILVLDGVDHALGERSEIRPVGPHATRSLMLEPYQQPTTPRLEVFPARRQIERLCDTNAEEGESRITLGFAVELLRYLPNIVNPIVRMEHDSSVTTHIMHRHSFLEKPAKSGGAIASTECDQAKRSVEAQALLVWTLRDEHALDHVLIVFQFRLSYLTASHMKGSDKHHRGQ